MKVNRIGSTRVVIELNKVVIKIPTTYSFKNFLSGWLANINECDTWRWNSGRYENGYSKFLAPVCSLWIFGLCLIMKKVDRTLSDSEYYLIKKYQKESKGLFIGDDKVQNYGVLYGTVVKIDYGSI